MRRRTHRSHVPKNLRLAPPRRVIGVTADLLRSDEIRKMSAVAVHAYKSARSSDPTPAYSVIDPRFGPPTTTDAGCATCGRRMHCPGHMGSILLSVPVYHTCFINSVLATLKCVCFFCCNAMCIDPGDENNEMYITAAAAAAALVTAEADAKAATALADDIKDDMADDPESDAIRRAASAAAVRLENAIQTDKHWQRRIAFMNKTFHRLNQYVNSVAPPYSSDSRTKTRRLVEVHHIGASKSRLRCCPWCAMPQPLYTRPSSTLRIDSTWSDEAAEEAEARIRATNVEVDAQIQAMHSPFNQARARAILSAIPNAQCEYLGMGDRLPPMVPVVVAIVPTTIRPTIMLKATARHDNHHITGRYSKISRINDKLTKWWRKSTTRGQAWARACLNKGTSMHDDGSHFSMNAEEMDQLRATASDMWNEMCDMQDMLAQIMDNSGRGCTKSSTYSGNAMSCLANELKGKPGVVRGCLASKRMNYSARTVISADPGLAMNQVGMPVHMANILTFPDRVTSLNIEDLRRAVIRGPGCTDGAAAVEMVDGAFRELAHLPEPKARSRERLAHSLRVGHLVHRHLRDGDVVLINRQPSLWKHSIMAMRVLRLPGKTIRINLSNTTPFNADFDGDEMTIHVPQNLKAAADAMCLVNVAANFLSPGNGAPSMGAVQDTLTALYAMTSPNTILDKDAASHCLGPASHIHGIDELDGIGSMDVDPVYLPPPTILVRSRAGRNRKAGGRSTWTPYWTGSSMVSGVTSRYGAAYHAGKESIDEVMQSQLRSGCSMWRGKLLYGRLDKKALGPSRRCGVLHGVALLRGSGAAIRLLVELQRLSQAWASAVGVSLSMRDMQSDPTVRRAIIGDMAALEPCVRTVIKAAEKYKVSREDLEAALTSLSACVDTGIGKRVDHMILKRGQYPGLMDVLSSGSKGSKAQLKQMLGSVGQQFLGDFRFGVKRLAVTTHEIEPAHSLTYNLVGGAAAPNVSSHIVPVGRLSSCMAHGDVSMRSRGCIASCFMDGITPDAMLSGAAPGRQNVVQKAKLTYRTGTSSRRLRYGLEGAISTWDGSVQWGVQQVQPRYGGDGFDPARMLPVSTTPFRVSGTQCASHFRGASPRLLSRFMRACLFARRTLMGTLWPKMPDSIPCPVSVRLLVSDRRLSPVSPNVALRLFHALYSRYVERCGATAATLMTAAIVWQVQDEVNRGRLRTGHRCARGDVQLASCIMSIIEQAHLPCGDPSGVIAAHSAGQPLMQIMLNSTHSGGRKETTQQGLPRLEEITGGACEKMGTPITQFSTTKPYTVTWCRNRLTQTRLENVVQMARICLHPMGDDGSGRGSTGAIIYRLADIHAMCELPPRATVPKVDDAGTGVEKAEEERGAKGTTAQAKGKKRKASKRSRTGTSTSKRARGGKGRKGVKGGKGSKGRKGIKVLDEEKKEETISDQSVAKRNSDDAPNRAGKASKADKEPVVFTPSRFAILIKLDRTAATRRGVTPRSIAQRIQSSYRRLAASSVMLIAKRDGSVGARGRRRTSAATDSGKSVYHTATAKQCDKCIDVKGAASRSRSGVRAPASSHTSILLTWSSVCDRDWYVVARATSSCGLHVTSAFANTLRIQLGGLTLSGIGGVGMVGTMSVRTHVTAAPVTDLDDELPQLIEKKCEVKFVRGAVLSQLSYLPWIRWYETSSNSIMHVLRTLGIWAARATMLQQLYIVFQGGGGVSLRHLQIMVDTAFCRGYFVKFREGGVTGGASGFLHRAAFMKHFATIVHAAEVGNTDNLDSINPSVFVGEPPPVGSGTVGVLRHEADRPVLSDARTYGILVPEAVQVAAQRRLPRKPVRMKGKAPTTGASVGAVDINVMTLSELRSGLRRAHCGDPVHIVRSSSTVGLGVFPRRWRSVWDEDCEYDSSITDEEFFIPAPGVLAEPELNELSDEVEDEDSIYQLRFATPEPMI